MLVTCYVMFLIITCRKIYLKKTRQLLRKTFAEVGGLKSAFKLCCRPKAKTTLLRLLGAVYTCPNHRPNRRPIPCMIYTQTELGSNSFSVNHYNGSFSHFRQKK
jgi:hypothetical protein